MASQRLASIFADLGGKNSNETLMSRACLPGAFAAMSLPFILSCSRAIPAFAGTCFADRTWLTSRERFHCAMLFLCRSPGFHREPERNRQFILGALRGPDGLIMA